METVIIAVNYNDSNNAIKFINNVKDYKVIDKIIIVDNNSSDNSIEVLKKLETKKITILDSKKNGGYSYGLNVGVKFVEKHYSNCNIIISNTDIIINNEKDIVDLINLKSEKSIIAPIIKEKNNVIKGWKIPNILEEIGFNIPLVNKFVIKKTLYNDKYYNGALTKVDTVSGCFFLTTLEFLVDINYFDEGVFLYYEENIFGVKAKLLNFPIFVANDISVYHNHSITIDKAFNKISKLKLQKKSQFYFQKKYGNCNKVSLMLLKLSAKLGIFILSIKYKLFNTK